MTFDVIDSIETIQTIDQVLSKDSLVYVGYVIKSHDERWTMVPLADGKWADIPSPLMGTHPGGLVYRDREAAMSTLRDLMKRGEIKIIKAFSTWIDVYRWLLEGVDYEEFLKCIEEEKPYERH